MSWSELGSLPSRGRERQAERESLGFQKQRQREQKGLTAVSRGKQTSCYSDRQTDRGSKSIRNI